MNVVAPEADCEGDDFDESGTCWKPESKQFLCPNDGSDSAGHASGSSHVYLYSDTSGIPTLYANLQYLNNGLGFAWPDRNVVFNPCLGNGTSECSCFNYDLEVK